MSLIHASGRYCGKLIFPWGYRVVLSNITRRQFELAGFSVGMCPERVICRDEIYEEAETEAFRKPLWNGFLWTPATPLSIPQIDRVRWHMHPEVRIAPPPGQKDLFDDDAPDVIRIMDLKQEQLARSLGQGHRVIHGVAGSGKTMILGFRCLQLARTLRKPILVLCYNRALAARLNAIMGESGAGHQVTVRNFHVWCREQLIRYHAPLPPRTKDDAEHAKQLVERLTKAVERGQIPIAQYGAVLVDEGHDFEPDWLKLIVQMVDPETNSLLLLYDDAQSIYRRARRRFSFKSAGVQAQGRTTILRLNYRNTAEVLRVAYEFAKDVLTPKEADEDGIPLIMPETANRHGAMPELSSQQSIEGEVDYIAERFRALNNDGTAWRDMAVIYRWKGIGGTVARRLQAAGIPAVNLPKKGQAGRLETAEDAVRLVTFHSSKGLEFPVVAIPGLGNLPGKQSEESKEVRFAYVAMTRAMDRLIMTYHRRSQFVQRLVRIGVPIAAGAGGDRVGEGGVTVPVRQYEGRVPQERNIIGLSRRAQQPVEKNPSQGR